jgi:hypothetical protein
MGSQNKRLFLALPICLLMTFCVTFTVLLSRASVCNADQNKIPEDLVGEWAVRKMKCEGNMWWHPVEFSIRKQGDDVFVFYDTYNKQEGDGSWTRYENIRFEEPMGKIFIVKDEFYYFEIILLQAYGITNKVRFYLYLYKNDRRLSGTLLRTVSFPVDQIDKAEEMLGSNRILEGTEKWAFDSSGIERQLVDIIVGSCEIRFYRND